MSLKLDFGPACEWCTDGERGFEYPVSIMELGEVKTMVTVAKAKNPIATVHFLKGFKSHPSHYKNLLDDMVEEGINVVLVTLPDPGDHLDYMEDYEDIARALFVKGEADHLIEDNLPKIAASHSTGSFLKMKLLTHDNDAKAISQRYDSTFSAAPFFGNKYHRMPLIGRLARLYSGLQQHVPVGTSWLERQFSELSEEERKDIKALANHRQALYMDGPTVALMEYIRNKGFSEFARDIRHTFLLSKHDQVSYNAHSKEVAKILGANVKLLDGGHSLVRKTQAGRNLLKYHVYNSLQKRHVKMNGPHKASGSYLQEVPPEPDFDPVLN